ncbi:MAG TPA: hypothetical protein VMB27_01800 [Solirubrobacteraceae bacterium]|nr:hypothetical protein [Solirubrobacteraceae bacterium]
MLLNEGSDWKGRYVKAQGTGAGENKRAAYEAPRLEQLGLFHVETQDGCFWGKQWGDHDAIGAITGLPIGNCSG